MNTAVTASELDVSVVDTGDRLSFTFFIALVLHAFLILGINPSLPDPDNRSRTIEITLATHKASQAPKDADFLAQHNQEASGTEEEAKQLTTERNAEFADSEVREVNPVPQSQAASPTKKEDVQVVSTTSESMSVTRVQKDPEPLDEQELRDGLMNEQTYTTEIASLTAKLDQQRQEYAKRPRIRRLTSVSTQESFDAKYLHEWSAKIEEVGNTNFPRDALNRRITGNLRLSVVINPDGTIHEIDLMQSSGQRVLDDAAIQIVRLASPFSVFPQEIRQYTDQLQIIRTWRFEITGLSTSDN